MNECFITYLKVFSDLFAETLKKVGLDLIPVNLLIFNICACCLPLYFSSIKTQVNM